MLSLIIKKSTKSFTEYLNKITCLGIECIDDASAKKLVLFIDDIMPKIAKLLPPFLQLKK